MSYLRRKHEGAREDEMCDLAFVERTVDKVHAFKYRGYFDEIPYAFKRDLRLIDSDTRPNVVRHTEKTSGNEYVQSLSPHMYIVLFKDGYTKAMDEERFNDRYRPTSDFHMYE